VQTGLQQITCNTSVALDMQLITTVSTYMSAAYGCVVLQAQGHSDLWAGDLDL